MTVVKEDHTRETFPISTSKFGLGYRRNTYETPTGRLAVAAKIGGGAATATAPDLGYKLGDKVKHDKFGVGTVVTMAPNGGDTQVTVAFPDPVGIKKLMASFAKLDKVKV